MSGYKYQEGKAVVPTQNVTINNCGVGFGQCGVNIGSETAGGVRDVTISNCVCDGTRRGLYLKTGRGRGASVENIRASNCVMRNVVDTAIWVFVWYVNGDRGTPQPIGPAPPSMGNIHCSDMIVTGTKRVALIEGLPERPIENLKIENLYAEGAITGIHCMHAKGMVLSRATINVTNGAPTTSHAVQDLEVAHFRGESAATSEHALGMNEVLEVLVSSSRATPGQPIFLELSEATSNDVARSLNRNPSGVQEFALNGGAPPAAIHKLT
jgi:polygalacturonase